MDESVILEHFRAFRKELAKDIVAELRSGTHV